MTKQTFRHRWLDAEVRRNPPGTQEACCRLAARAHFLGGGTVPKTEAEWQASALGAARGLFGPAFETADDGQRWAWIEMCERAHREVLAEIEGGK